MILHACPNRKDVLLVVIQAKSEVGSKCEGKEEKIKD